MGSCVQKQQEQPQEVRINTSQTVGHQQEITLDQALQLPNPLHLSLTHKITVAMERPQPKSLEESPMNYPEAAMQSSPIEWKTEQFHAQSPGISAIAFEQHQSAIYSAGTSTLFEHISTELRYVVKFSGKPIFKQGQGHKFKRMSKQQMKGKCRKETQILLNYIRSPEEQAKLVAPLPPPPSLTALMNYGTMSHLTENQIETENIPAYQTAETPRMPVEQIEQEEIVEEVEKPQEVSAGIFNNMEQSISLDSEEAAEMKEEFNQPLDQPKQQFTLQSSRGENLIVSFAPNRQQVYQAPDNEIHRPANTVAVTFDAKTLKIENEFVVALLEQLEPMEINSGSEGLVLGPMVFIDTGDIYIGSWQNGKRHGFGRQVFYDGTYYEGLWSNGEINGFGRLIHTHGDYYQGEFFNNQKNGYGFLVYHDGSKYEGKWELDQKNGEGREQLSDGVIYIGTFKTGVRHGNGRLESTDGTVFEGEFKDGLICGFGVQIWPDGKRYEGHWKDDMMHGIGEFYWCEGKKYKGDYYNNIRHGFGEYHWPDGRTYKGAWKNGMMDGKGLMIYPDQRLQKGIWKKGQRQLDKNELAAEKRKSTPSKSIISAQGSVLQGNQSVGNASDVRSKKSNRSKSNNKK